MRVVSMALIDVGSFLLSLLCVALAFMTSYWVGCAYLQSILLLVLLYLTIVRIPLVLNWSSNLYSSVFIRVFFFQVFSTVTYAICYNSHGDFSKKFSSYWDALYFSATTWTTLGPGDISPTGEIRFLTAIHALTGLFTLPVLASVIWLYCEKRLWDKTQEEKGKEDYQLTTDNALGFFKEIESDKTTAEQEKRDKIKLKSCNCGEPDPHIEKYFDVLGVLTPLPKFVVHCRGCGEFSKPQRNAYVAAWIWNRKKHNNKYRRTT